MAVITIIGLLSTLVIPSLLSIFSAGADAQACALLSAQISAARAMAMKTSCYTCVHIQQSDPGIGGPDHGKYFMCVMIRGPATNNFNHDLVMCVGQINGYARSGNTAVLSDNTSFHTTTDVNRPTWQTGRWNGYSVRIVNSQTKAVGQYSRIISTAGSSVTVNSTAFTQDPVTGDYYVICQPTGIDPVSVPGTMAFGRLASPFADLPKNAFQSAYMGSSTATLDATLIQLFTTVNIIFSPSGTVVYTTDGGGPCTSPMYDATGTNVLYSSTGGVIFDTKVLHTQAYMAGLFLDPTASSPIRTGMEIWPVPQDDNWAANFTGNTPPATPSRYQCGTTSVVLFDSVKFTKYPYASRAGYLNSEAQYLPINVYTGQLLPRR